MRILEIISCFFCAVSMTSAMQTLYMDELCGKTEHISSYPTVRIQLSRSSVFSLYKDCILELYGGYIFEDQMMIQFKSLDVPSPCDDNWLALHDGDDSDDPLIGYGHLCGMPDTIYTTNGSKLTLNVSKQTWSSTGVSFEMILTHFKTGFCASYEYRCPNDRCIDDDIRCNGLNPCGDGSSACDWFTPGRIGVIAGGSAMLVVAIIVIVVVIVVRRRFRKPARRIPTTFALSAVTQSQYGQQVMSQQVQM